MMKGARSYVLDVSWIIYPDIVCMRDCACAWVRRQRQPSLPSLPASPHAASAEHVQSPAH